MFRPFLMTLVPEPVIWCTPSGPDPPAVDAGVKPVPTMATLALGTALVGVTVIAAANTVIFGAELEEPVA